ncbi:MAG: hypothetical protein HC769_05970 [Cyanobacteria bacterium CRU_2_1]|nr:hypothetical protein [Cyanobacteria bacterium CRU_2_1]
MQGQREGGRELRGGWVDEWMGGHPTPFTLASPIDPSTHRPIDPSTPTPSLQR